MYQKIIPNTRQVLGGVQFRKSISNQYGSFTKIIVEANKQVQINKLENSLFWQSFGEQLTVSEAQIAFQQLDLSLPLGVNNDQKEYSNFEVIQELKSSNPNAVLVVGDSQGQYCAYGIDAVAVIETGLVAKSGMKGIIAKISKSRFQQVNQKLLSYGFHVNVAESNNVKGQRKITKILTALDSSYSPRGLQGVDVNETRTKHIVCIDILGNGLDLYLCSADQNVIDFYKGISASVAVSLIMSKVVVTPVLVHQNELKESDYLMDAVDVLKTIRKLLKENCGIRLNQIKYFQDQSTEVGFRSQLSSVFNVIGTPVIRLGDSSSRIIDVNTAKQIGVEINPMVPSLIGAVIGKQSKNQSIVAWIKHLLYNPPHPVIRDCIHRIIWQYTNKVKNCPDYAVPSKSLNLSTIKNSLPQALKSVILIKNMFLAVLASFSMEAMKPVFGDMLFIATFQVGVKISSAQKLLRMCYSFNKNLVNFRNVRGKAALNGLHKNLHNELGKDQQFVQFLTSFFWKQEKDVHSYVSHVFISRQIQALEVARSLLLQVLSQHLCPNGQMVGPKSPRSYVTDQVEGCIYLSEDYEETLTAKRFHVRKTQVLIQVAKKQREMVHICQTEALDLALEAYQIALEETDEAVKGAFRSIYDQVQQNLDYFHIVVQMNIIGQALRSHGEQAMRGSWTSCEFIIRNQNEKQSNLGLQLNSCWPYWKTITQSTVISNSVDLCGVEVVTGPNMGGKSTYMRTVTTCALLGNCGLMLPAEGAIVPYYDQILYRCFVGDNPMENISAWAMECKQVQEIYDVCGSDSLFAYDEFGKGTDPAAGASLLLSCIKNFSQNNMQGLFSTHYSNEVNQYSKTLFKTDSVQYMCMQSNTKQQWALIRGISTDCKAFEVAASCGLDTVPLLPRAVQLYNNSKQIQSQGQQQQLGQCDESQKTLKVQSQDRLQNVFACQVNKNQVSFELLIQQATQCLEECVEAECKRTQMQMPKILTNLLRPGEQPGPRVTSARCAYIYLSDTPDHICGSISILFDDIPCAIYVGQTTNIDNRIKKHKKDRQKKGEEVVVFWVAAVQHGTIDVIKSVETELLKLFKKYNYRLLTKKDMNNQVNSV